MWPDCGDTPAFSRERYVREEADRGSGIENERCVVACVIACVRALLHARVSTARDAPDRRYRLTVIERNQSVLTDRRVNTRCIRVLSKSLARGIPARGDHPTMYRRPTLSRWCFSFSYSYVPTQTVVIHTPPRYAVSRTRKGRRTSGAENIYTGCSHA